MKNNYFFRVIKVLAGLMLFALGSYLVIQANVGLGPWEAFGTGIANITGLTYGTVTVGVGILILIIDILLKEKIGVGTILNTFLIGAFVDLYAKIGLLPKIENFWLGLLVLLLGQFSVSVAIVLYVGQALGAGPRDSLMVALGRRINRVPIGAVRGLIEGTVLVVGWLLGAKIGVGTVIAVFGISFILQFTFKLFKFDVKAVAHESLLDTFKNIFGKRDKQ